MANPALLWLRRDLRVADQPALAAAINDMLDGRDHWPAMRSAGRDFVERVRNWRRSVANYGPVYGALAGRSAR